MSSFKYQASYDVLAITVRLERLLRGVSPSEVHMLAYLACLLSLYRGRPIASWGYQFVRSEWGVPFSDIIENAINQLQVQRLVQGDGKVLYSTAEGRDFVDHLDRMHQHGWRAEIIEGACASALAMPLGAIRDALKQDPSIRAATVHTGTRKLLVDGQNSTLYSQFEALEAALSNVPDDLMVPAVVWLTYLSQRNQQEQRAAAPNSEEIISASAEAVL